MDRRAVLIAMGKAGLLTPERSLFVRSANETEVKWRLVEWEMPAAILQTAGMPALRFNANRRRFSEEQVQTYVNRHLMALGLDPTPVEFVHPNLADRVDLHETWESNLRGVECQWAYHLYHHRVARLLALAELPAWKPLITILEHGVHPYGLSPEAERFFVVDPAADHDKAIREWDAQLIASG